MVDPAFVILDGGRPVELAARVEGARVLLDAASLRALGWELQAGLLCSDALCVPVPDGIALEREGGVDLAALATVLDRPIAVDPEERAAYLGIAMAERRRALASPEAPEFSLPDLEGRRHSLSEHRGRKILLVAYASW